MPLTAASASATLAEPTAKVVISARPLDEDRRRRAPGSAPGTGCEVGLIEQALGRQHGVDGLLDDFLAGEAVGRRCGPSCP